MRRGSGVRVSGQSSSISPEPSWGQARETARVTGPGRPSGDGGWVSSPPLAAGAPFITHSAVRALRGEVGRSGRPTVQGARCGSGWGAQAAREGAAGVGGWTEARCLPGSQARRNPRWARVSPGGAQVCRAINPSNCDIPVPGPPLDSDLVRSWGPA